MRLKNRIIILIGLASVLILGFGWFYLDRVAGVIVTPPKKVNWNKHKVIVFESDDWGLCAVSPDLDTYHQFSSFDFINEATDKRIEHGKTTLESVEDLDNLFKVLTSFKGRDGRYVVFQANYVVSNPNFEEIENSHYCLYSDLIIPDVPSRWQRGDFIAKAKEGIEMGIWHPEFHGNSHFNPKNWLKKIKNKHSLTLKAFALQTVVNADRADNNEFDEKLSKKEQEEIIKKGIDRFYKLFGYYPKSFIAPNFYWQDKTEETLSKNGIKIIQAKSSQEVRRSLIEKIIGKLANFRGKRVANKHWQIKTGDFNPRLNLTYLNRNAHFEPWDRTGSQMRYGSQKAYQEIIVAWKNNAPAIIGTHRINYVYLDKEKADENLKELAKLLNLIQTEHPEAVYLTDDEVAQLYQEGNSILMNTNEIICRNYTSSNMTLEVEVPHQYNLKYIERLPYEKKLEYTQKDNRVWFIAEPGDYRIVLDRKIKI